MDHYHTHKLYNTMGRVERHGPGGKGRDAGFYRFRGVYDGFWRILLADYRHMRRAGTTAYRARAILMHAMVLSRDTMQPFECPWIDKEDAARRLAEHGSFADLPELVTA